MDVLNINDDDDDLSFLTLSLFHYYMGIDYTLYKEKNSAEILSNHCQQGDEILLFACTVSSLCKNIDCVSKL